MMTQAVTALGLMENPTARAGVFSLFCKNDDSSTENGDSSLENHVVVIVWLLVPLLFLFSFEWIP